MLVQKGSCFGWLKLSVEVVRFFVHLISFKYSIAFIKSACDLMKNLSPDVILCGWLGSKHQLTN